MKKLILLGAMAFFCCTGFADGNAAEDLYLEFKAVRPMNLRHFMGPQTKVLVDFALVDTTTKQQRIVGIKWHHGIYVNGSGGLTFQSQEGLSGSGDKKNTVTNAVDTLRHIGIIDVPAKKHVYMTAGVTNAVMPFTNPTAATTDSPLFLCGASNGADGEATVGGYDARARIYGVKIWEAGELVHDYRPMRVDGLDGLQDEVDGVFLPAGALADVGAAAELGGSDEIVNRPGLAYLESDGHQGIVTDYVITPRSRLVFDFAATAKQTNTRLANAGNSTSGLYLDFYTSSSYGITFFTHDAAGGWTPTQKLGTHSSALPMTTNLYVRRTYEIDWKNATFGLSTADFSNQSFAISKPPTLSANDTLTFLRGTSSQMAKGRFYGAKVYEDDVLAANYVPTIKDGIACLHETVGNKYFYNSVPAGVTATPFVPGGRCELKTDAYLESDGTQVINTGYFSKPNSRVEVDYCLNETAAQVRVFGTDSSSSKSVQLLYINGSGNYSFINNSSWTGQVDTKKMGDTVRHTAVIDRANGVFVLKTGADEIYRSAFTDHGNTSLHPMGIFGAVNKADGSEISELARRAKMKLYSFRIYEDNVLVHEFLPYSNGEIVGLYDTKTGAIKENTASGASAFEIGGAGAFIKGLADAVIGGWKSMTFKVYAPGAVAYRWTLDGETIDGAPSDSVTIDWRSRKTPSVLSVTPVYRLDGSLFEGEPSTANLTFSPQGLFLLIR